MPDQNGFICDLSANHFADNKGQILPDQTLLEMGYNEKQLPYIKERFAEIFPEGAPPKPEEPVASSGPSETGSSAGSAGGSEGHAEE